MPTGSDQSLCSCRRCHAHKVKCSGEQPCTKCQQAGLPDGCEYEARDHKVTVNASYIDQLLSENRRLKEQVASSVDKTSDGNEASLSPVQEGIADPEQRSRNPLIGDRAWFHPYDAAALPIYIGEAACTAFVTRFRRFLTGNSAAPHMTPTQYADKAILLEAGKIEVPWPPFPKAQLLVKVTFSQVSRVYHMMLQKST